jgi:hypothetical protein
MNKQHPISIVITLWEKINTSPWVTLERIDNGWGPTLNFEMTHSKTLARQTFQLAERDIYRLTDPWTREYVVGQLTTALAALTHNTVEASTGSLDVYRDDCP